MQKSNITQETFPYYNKETNSIIVDHNIVLSPVNISMVNEVYRNVDEYREILSESLDWVKSTTLEKLTEYLNKVILDHKEDRQKLFAIYYKKELAGLIGFNQFDKINKIAIIGYYLFPPFWKKNIMFFSVVALTQIFYKEFGIHRFEARVNQINISSQKVLIRANFKNEGIARSAGVLNGQRYDQQQFSYILPDDHFYHQKQLFF